MNILQTCHQADTYAVEGVKYCQSASPDTPDIRIPDTPSAWKARSAAWQQGSHDGSHLHIFDIICQNVDILCRDD